MNGKRPVGWFITGTSTGVGKTHVAACLARAAAAAGLRVGVYKPVASGCRRAGNELISDDAEQLWEAAGRPGTLEKVCPQRFEAPLAPHLAARQVGERVDAQQLRDGLRYWQHNSDIVLVEGAGGLMSPLSDDDYVVDLAAEFQYPLIVVAANVLGTINSTLQTLITAASYGEGLEIAGIILNDVADSANDPSSATNRAELEQRCVPPLLAHIAWGQQHLDWGIERFRPKEEAPGHGLEP